MNQTGNLGDNIKKAFCIMKTSTDGGRQWSGFKRITPSGMTEIGACKGLYDAEHKKVLVQYAHCPSGDCSADTKSGKKKWFQMKADEDCKTFTSPKDISSMLTAGDCPVMPGTVAGNRIQLRDTHRILWGGSSHNKPCMWYSDDGGDTYKTKWVRNLDSPNEFSLVQAPDGRVYMNSRAKSGTGCGDKRVESWSSDGGLTWSDAKCSSLQAATNQNVHDCEASMTYWNGQILFFNPSTHGGPRGKMKVHCSTNGKSWSGSYSVSSTADGGYSDLITTDKNTKLLMGFSNTGASNVWAISHDLDFCKSSEEVVV